VPDAGRAARARLRVERHGRRHDPVKVERVRGAFRDALGPAREPREAAER
jgi:hypothetical protein